MARLLAGTQASRSRPWGSAPRMRCARSAMSWTRRGQSTPSRRGDFEILVLTDFENHLLPESGCVQVVRQHAAFADAELHAVAGRPNLADGQHVQEHGRI